MLLCIAAVHSFFHCYVFIRCMNILHFKNPLSCQWTSGFFPDFCYFEGCIYEYSCTGILPRMFLLSPLVKGWGMDSLWPGVFECSVLLGSYVFTLPPTHQRNAVNARSLLSYVKLDFLTSATEWMGGLFLNTYPFIPFKLCTRCMYYVLR